MHGCVECRPEIRTSIMYVQQILIERVITRQNTKEWMHIAVCNEIESLN